MSKKPHTAESRIKPGSKDNVSVAVFGDQSGPEFDRMRGLVFAWLNAADALKLGEKAPEYREKVERDHQKLAHLTVEVVTNAIISNRPEDLRKLADVIERCHETKIIDEAGNIRFPAISGDIYQVWAHHHLTQQAHPNHKFSFAEMKRVVARFRDEDPEEANESLDKRTRRILKKLGIELSSDSKN